MDASHAIAPVMSLAGCWSPLPASDDAMTASATLPSHWQTRPASPQPQLLPDNKELQYLSHDRHLLLQTEMQLSSPPVSPASNCSFTFPTVLSYSTKSDCFQAFAPAAAGASRKRGLDDDKLGPPSFLKRSVSSISASSSSELQLLTGPLSPSRSKKLQSSSHPGDGLRAPYPLLNSAVVNGFFANMSSSVMSGMDDAELGLLPPEAEADKVKESGGSDKPSIAKPSMRPPLPVSRLPPLPLPIHSPSRSSQLSTSSHTSAASCVSSTKSSVSFFFAPPDSSSASRAAEDPSALETDGQGEVEVRRRTKRRLTDKQRRAKIKDGLKQLRRMVALHGSSTSSDQTALVNSVDLLQQLVTEKEQLRQQLRVLMEERADIEGEQRALRMTAIAVLSSSSSSSTSALQAADVGQQPKLGLLLLHLLNVLNANAGSQVGSGCGGGMLGDGG
jgi:hypothetical protein